jgi:hypothetical protein
VTLDTTLVIKGPVNLEALRAFCAQQLGVPAGVPWYEQPSDVLDGYVLLTPVERDFGGAHLSILYRPGEDRTGREVEVTWITGWGSMSPAGEKPVPFHSRLAAELGTWLIERGLMVEVRWHS